jgi:hypothetical protein
LIHFQLGFYTQARGAELRLKILFKDQRRIIVDVHYRCDWRQSSLSIASKVTTTVARKFGDISTIVFIERLSHGRGFWKLESC